EAPGATLRAMARSANDERLGGSPAEKASLPWLLQSGATFVTLIMLGALRGCVGSLQAARPLVEGVARHVLRAAFRDPRFAPLAAAEWPEVRVEVSLLSAPRPMRFADEDVLLSQVVAGEDGVILEHAGRRATFLPQVWESLPDKRRFLGELVKKAGLPADTRLSRCKIARYRVAKWKETDRH